ncbi:MAG: deoxyribonuclease IV [Eggerthellaceae bacterium]|nr:deoxyribonuclease IV [Eggerthellaceae bacterium]
MAKEAESINANTFQYFTRNPRGGAQAMLKEKDVEEFNANVASHGLHDILAYAPYSANPATDDQQERDFALLVYSQDLARLEEMPGQLYLIRPGNALKTPVEKALANVAEALNEVITEAQQTPVLIDTLSGEGTQVGRDFEQIEEILEQVKLQDHVGVCIDTSALWAAGYDIVNDLDGVLDKFDKVIGLNRLMAVHLNDSKESLGSRVDRHARIGEGQIGFEALAAIINNDRLKDKPFYLEEPESTLVIYERDVAKFQAAYKG